MQDHSAAPQKGHGQEAPPTGIHEMVRPPTKIIGPSKEACCIHSSLEAQKCQQTTNYSKANDDSGRAQKHERGHPGPHALYTLCNDSSQDHFGLYLV